MNNDNKRNEEYDDLSEFNRYRHYLNDESQGSDEVNSSDDSAEYEDITSYSEGNADFYMQPRNNEELVYDYDSNDKLNDMSKNIKKNKGNFFTRNGCRNIKITALSLVIVLLLASGGGIAWFYYYYFSDGQYDDNGLDFNDPFAEQEIYEEDHNWQAMGDVDSDSLNGFLYSWANNGGEKMYSKNVINVLLCGVDSETGKSDAGRSDIMMLVSINKKTETITMVSLLRDSWTYMSLPRENGTYYDHYFKLNAAYSYGGPVTLLNTIENNYKIEIDEFIAVDFVSFPKLIDALGGVTVDVQDYEANYIRRTSAQKDFPKGTATLNGKQALIYSRIRKCDADSDISRTRRQRSVIKGLIDSAKGATNGQLLNAFKQVSPYLRTGYNQSEVMKLIAQAYSNGWMDYDMVEIVLPSEDYVDRASTKINGQWAWVVDYALCAQKLQNALYGESNIVLDDNRNSVLDLVVNRDNHSSSESSSSSNSNSSSGYDSDYNSGSDYDTSNPEDTDVTENTDTTDTDSNDRDWSDVLPSLSDKLPVLTLPNKGNDKVDSDTNDSQGSGEPADSQDSEQ